MEVQKLRALFLAGYRGAALGLSEHDLGELFDETYCALLSPSHS